MSEFHLPPLAGFGEWGPSFVTAKAPVVYNQALPLRASLWYDQDAAKPEQELREAFINSVFSKNEQVVLQERLVAYVKDIKDAEAATKRTQYDKSTGRFNAASRDQYHDVTKAVAPSQIKGNIAIDNLWAAKPSFAPPKAKTLLHVCGRPPLYNDSIEKAKFSAPIPLREDVEVINRTAITGDEIVSECVEELHNEGVTCPIVVTSDEVLAAIMAAPATVNSWDIEVLTAEGLIFIDRRDGGNTSVEWVNENANGEELPSDTTDEDAVDSRAHLGVESTKASFAFNVQCAAKGFYQGKTEPLREDTHARKIMYRYYQYIVNEDLPSQYYLIVRSEVDIAETAADGSMKAYRAFGLLEFVPPKPVRSYRPNPSIAWTDSAALSVLLVDVARKNVGKVTRWIIMSYLSDALMKIGFITRKGDSIKTHAVGGVTTISPQDFARSINVDFTKLWSALSTVVEAIIKSKVEVGGIIRQGGEKQLRIFADDAGDSDDDEDGDEEDEDDDDDSDDDEDDESDDE